MPNPSYSVQVDDIVQKQLTRNASRVLRSASAERFSTEAIPLVSDGKLWRMLNIGFDLSVRAIGPPGVVLPQILIEYQLIGRGYGFRGVYAQESVLLPSLGSGQITYNSPAFAQRVNLATSMNLAFIAQPLAFVAPLQGIEITVTGGMAFSDGITPPSTLIEENLDEALDDETR